MRELFLKRMKEFSLEAGQIALQYLGDSEPGLKTDRSVITKADREVSELAHLRFADLLSQPQHLMIDEESPNTPRYLDQEFLNSKEYIWALDPIDGTRIYANSMPYYGISFGLMKSLKPWLGVVYFPSLRELFYCDGENAYFVEHVGSSQEKITKIAVIDEVITGQSIFLSSDNFFKRFEWVSKDCHFIIPACAVVDLCWPTVGRGCGGLLKSYVWDFAGSWPIFRAAGLDLRAYDTGKVMDRLDVDLFIKENRPWKLKEYYILSSERNYPILKEKLVIKKSLSPV
jgi:myo-inositol-1(or 4)-monophosphatase